MKSIKISCPAKINLSLKVINKRKDGFHNIESVMQTIDLFDYLDICITDSSGLEIILDGNSSEIPYDERNLVHKAANLYCKTNNITNKKISVYIEKNIPVSAGLGGGSSDAAGMLYGLNKLFDEIISDKDLHNLCSKLGSDLNVCLKGGCLLAKGRGEIIEPCMFTPRQVNLIKPANLSISAAEAYGKFSEKINNPDEVKLRGNYVNDLEWAVIEDYPQLRHIKDKYPNSVMTGSGSAYYSLSEEFMQEADYQVKNGLHTIDYGVCVCGCKK